MTEEERIEHQRALGREKSARYRKRHPEKVAAQRAAWQKANAEKIATGKKAYRAANPDKVLQDHRTYFERHRNEPDYQERHREANRRHYQKTRPQKLAYGAQWRAENSERHRAMISAWHAANKERQYARVVKSRAEDPMRWAAYGAIRRARLRNVTIEPVDYNAIAARDAGICGICQQSVSTNDWSFDHIIPLSKGGAHSEANLQLTHRICNTRKNARTAPISRS